MLAFLDAVKELSLVLAREKFRKGNMVENKRSRERKGV